MLNIPSSYSYLPVTQDGGLKTATFELRTFLERFGNGQSMYIMFDATNTLVYDTNKNKELGKWFKRTHMFARFVVYSSSFCFASVYVLSCRSCSKQATSLSPTATNVVTKFATSVAISTTESTKNTLIVCSRQSKIGSRPRAKIRLISASGRIGPGSPKIRCLIAKAAWSSSPIYGVIFGKS